MDVRDHGGTKYESLFILSSRLGDTDCCVAGIWTEGREERKGFLTGGIGKVLKDVDLTLTNCNYADCLLDTGRNTVIFGDPPYDIQRNDMYGYNGELHRSFNHRQLAHDMRNCPLRWMLSYNDNDDIRRLYADYDRIPYDLTYWMRNFRQDGKKAVKSC